MKRISYQVIVSIIFLGTFSLSPLFASDKSKANDRNLTEKEAKILNGYKLRQVLIAPLMQHPGNPGFNKETLYVMENFKIVQKIDGGYLITTDSMVWNSGSSINYGVAFLKTSKKIPQDVLISGLVIYSEEYKYTALNGFEQTIPLLKIPVDLPISGLHLIGNSIEPEYY